MMNDMHRSLVFIVAAISQASFATPPSPIPPEPANLAAAKRFVAELSLEDQVEHGYSLRTRVVDDATKNAEEWLRRTHPTRTSDILQWSFSLKAKEKAARTLLLAVPAVKGQLAIGYAYRMRAVDLDAIAEFFSTEPGKAYVDATVADSSFVTDKLVQESSNLLGLEELYRSAHDAEQLLQNINR